MFFFFFRFKFHLTKENEKNGKKKTGEKKNSLSSFQIKAHPGGLTLGPWKLSVYCRDWKPSGTLSSWTIQPNFT